MEHMRTAAACARVGGLPDANSPPYCSFEAPAHAVQLRRRTLHAVPIAGFEVSNVVALEPRNQTMEARRHWNPGNVDLDGGKTLALPNCSTSVANRESIISCCGPG